MKRKTLGILLVIPFILGLLSFVSVIVFTRVVKLGIQSIGDWNYKASEGFKIQSQGYELKATPIYPDDSKTIDETDHLVWSASGDGSIASVSESDGIYYLNAKSKGEVVVTCYAYNNPTVSRSFNAVVYENGSMVLNVKKVGKASTSSSFNASDSLSGKLNVGEYDLSYSEAKKGATSSSVRSSLQLDIDYMVDNISSDPYTLLDKSDNVEFDRQTSTVSFTGTGEAYVTLGSKVLDEARSTFSFNIVEDGYNVYSYDDLMMCTNYDSNGKIAVMQTSLYSLGDVYKALIGAGTGGQSKVVGYSSELIDSSMEGAELFGHFVGNLDDTSEFNSSRKSFSFDDEVYEFISTYHTEYIDQFFASKGYGEEEANEYKTLKAGIHVTKDFYGNGFTINMSNLCYPYHGDVDTTYKMLVPSEYDYFKGPLPYVAVGDITGVPIVEAYAQDNIGMYVDGDGITIDDVRIQNSDTQSELYNLSYVGTVMEIDGDGITVKNSIIQNGKNNIRAFSAQNFTLDNCIIQNSIEFLMLVGSNTEYKTDKSKRFVYSDSSLSIDKSFTEFYDDTADGDNMNTIVTNSLMGKYSNDAISKLYQTMQEGFDNSSQLYDSSGNPVYDSTVTVRDCSFANSGIFSIAVETSFNGPYLYNGSPIIVGSLFGSLSPSVIGGTSLPSKITLEGKTRFYDYKNIDDVATTSLISENISSMLGSMDSSGSGELSVSIDDFFPIKEALRKVAKSNNQIYSVTDGEDTLEYIDTAVVYYGGGLNLSTVEDNTSVDGFTLSDKTTIDMLPEYLNVSTDLKLQSYDIGAILAKAVLCVTGTHPFYYYSNSAVESGKTPALFGEKPDLANHRANR